MNNIKIIIADKQETYRYSIKKLLHQLIETHVVAEPETAHELLETLKKVTADLVIIDINLPYFNEMNGIIKAIEKIPNIKVIATSLFEEDIDSQSHAMLQETNMYQGFFVKPTEKKQLEPLIRNMFVDEFQFSKN